MQESRFELKYFITEEIASRMREFVRSYLDIDEFGMNQPDFSYPTLSLYLDSERLDTYWHTINGNKNRFKLRLRYYDEKPDSPVFFEIKRRMNNVILKQRAGVHKSAVKLLLSGQMPERDHLFQPNSGEQLVALQNFIELMVQIEARPMMHIAYMREAYENADNNAVRLTFDHFVESYPNPEGHLIAKSNPSHRVFDPFLVLELKFTDRHPIWFRHLVESYDLMQGGAAKYAEGIFTRGEDWVHQERRPKPPDVLVDEFLAGEGWPIRRTSLHQPLAG